MNKKTLIIVGVIGFLIIFILCALLHLRSIEKDIAYCLNNTLEENNIKYITVDTHNMGRNAKISGKVTASKTKNRIMKLLEGECHIQSLEENIQVIPPPKPTIKPLLHFKFDNKTKTVEISGNISSTNEINRIIGSFKNKTRGMKIKNTVLANNKVYRTNYPSDVIHIFKKTNRVSNLDVTIFGNKITIKGKVKSKKIKKRIGNQLKKVFNNRIVLENLLKINTQLLDNQQLKYKPLAAKECQQELTTIMSKSTIRFNTNSSEINQTSFKLLSKLAKIAKACQKVKIDVIGHTDNTGNPENNKKLSYLRARSVLNFLISKSVQLNKLTAFGEGSTKPIASNDTVEGRAKNRRIEFKVHSL